jgi:4a-hydroxytetrahydrobiopterin dehydratase
MDLSSERCVACHAGAPPVPAEEIPALLDALPGWDLVEVDGVKRLRRVYRLKGWKPAVRLVNEIADLAAAEGHHPALTLEWGRVTVEWWTHAIGGLHRNDFVMAAKVDTLREEG